MRVLFTTDGSPCSMNAIREGLRLLPTEGLQAAIIAVADPAPVTYGFDGMGPGGALVATELEVSSERALALAAERLERAGIHATLIERCGDAGREIVAVAEELDPDVIVLGSHGRNGVARLFMGSVSSHVVHHWRGATLVVRPKE